MRSFLTPRWTRLVTHAAALIPLAVLSYQFFSGQLDPNPAQALEQRSGRVAISMLTATLAVSPLAILLDQPVLRLARRPLGLYTFFYVVLHVLVLTGLDYGFDLTLLIRGYLGKPFIWFGLATGLILTVLALTSFDWWKRILGAWWKRSHLLIYPAAILALTHFFLAVKGNLFTLSGNLVRPLVYAGLILFFLALRLFFSRSSITPSR